MSDDNAHASRIAEQLAINTGDDVDDTDDADEHDDEPGEGGDSSE